MDSIAKARTIVGGTGSSLGHVPEGRWAFDDSVTQVFDDLLQRSIPQHDVMRRAVFNVGRKFVQPETDIVDLGCSRGEAVAPFVAQYGAENRYIGVEVSPPMLKACRRRFREMIDSGRMQVLDLDLRHGYPRARSSLTLAVLTMQFTPIEYRQRVVQDIWKHLVANGAFIMVEKILGATADLDALMVDYYYQMKREAGYRTPTRAALLGDQRPVWAVESNPVFCTAIQQAAALNGFIRVRVLQAVLSDRSRTVAIDDVSVLASPEEGPGRRIAQAVTLDELCAREAVAPTIVKIDVHGAEGRVLRGMSRLLRETIQVVLLELHALHEYQPSSPDVTRVELLEGLEQSGFSVFHVAGHRWEHLSGVRTHLEHGRFAYVPVTAATRQYLLYDRPVEVLIVASKGSDLAELLGPSVDLATAVG